MGQCRSPSVSPSRQAVSSTSLAQEELSLFQQYQREGNPFEMHMEHKEEETEDVLASNGVSVRKHTPSCKKVKNKSCLLKVEICYNTAVFLGI